MTTQWYYHILAHLIIKGNISIHNGNSLSPPQPAFLDSAADQSTGPFSSPTKVTTLPCFCPQGTLIHAPEERLVLKKAAVAAALLYHHILPVTSQPSRPLYLHALAERAAAALTTPTSLTPELVTPAWPLSQCIPKTPHQLWRLWQKRLVTIFNDSLSSGSSVKRQWRNKRQRWQRQWLEG
jgi:hypothetical protein